ncbi:hypothetical protein DUNSADRAFT_16197 [Dunaliella salina]|uniref:Uncharacterized protein n=1 Tax=Dunaliella salina TaxID=3046 RepID=A0ABQ7FVK2_DUNSA|nr:hypothetical protein DUNSADRAFT_16197 [Dunaliella salina]|eukprot:KAF5829352.1 hypothetical protein DUNSADRAFT_16197 [Dunaliella salina]
MRQSSPTAPWQWPGSKHAQIQGALAEAPPKSVLLCCQLSWNKARLLTPVRLTCSSLAMGLDPCANLV